jgi:hypothetical protein
LRQQAAVKTGRFKSSMFKGSTLDSEELPHFDNSGNVQPFNDNCPAGGEF